jgi:hypothetical protein
MMGALMERLGVRERIGLSIAGLCVAALLVDVAVVGPLGHQIDALEDGIADVQRKLDYNRDVLRLEAPVREEYERVRGLIGSADSKSRASDALTATVDALARTSRIDCPLMGPRAPLEKPFYDEFVVEVGKFEGPVSGLLSFLHAVSREPGLLRVVAFSVSPDKVVDTVKGSLVVTKVMSVDESETPPPESEG